MMKHFPIFVNLVGRDCLVVGNGAAAAAKARRLASAGAHVHVICDQPKDELYFLAQEKLINISNRKFREDDVKGMALVISASGMPEIDLVVSESAKKFDVPINVVDRVELSNFIIPAVVDRGPLQIGISTGGAAPSLASRVRGQIEQLLPEGMGKLATFAHDHRAKVKELIPEARPRRIFWRKFFDGKTARAVADDVGWSDEKDISSLIDGIAEKSETVGEVAIVGAGPGDPDLLTLKALHKLQMADVIVYDRLVTPEILDRGRRDAKRIFVGKASGQHTCGQEEIHQILLEESRQGKYVVRLKGGDPFIFGRGGEERSFLLSQGVPVEVVPGITAALGCGAAAGIPMTHRNMAQAVTFITGHGEEEPRGDWEALANLRHSLVIYMGVGSAGKIATRLIEHGKDPATPVAVIANGTTLDQKFVKGRLGKLESLITNNKISAPALIIIGNVVEESNLETVVGKHIGAQAEKKSSLNKDILSYVGNGSGVYK